MDVAVDDNEKFHFVWSETTVPSYTLYYSYTNAAGTTPQPITAVQDEELLSPAIAVSDGDNRVHVVWAQGASSIKYARKTIGPSTSWSSSSITSSVPWAIHSDIAVTSAGAAHVVWSEGNPSSADIFYAKSSDGSVWSPPFKVSGDASNDGRSPAIAVSGNNVYVVWTEWVNKEQQYIRFRQSGDGGNSWGGSVRISENSFAANADSPTFLRPAIAVDSNEKLHVAFNGSGGLSDPEDIYYASKTQIASWICCRNLTYNFDGNNTTPDIAASGEDVHLVWAGPPLFPLEPNDYEVSYKRTVTWGAGVIYLPIIMKSF